MDSLRGIRVALLEARVDVKLEALVRRNGGEPYGVCALAERCRASAAEVTAFIDALDARSVLVSTRDSARALLDAADALGRGDEVRARMSDAVRARGRDVMVLHHGERDAEIVERLALRGARIRELLLCEWTLPEDPAPLRRLVEEIIERRVGAIAFTNHAQARHLLSIANGMRCRDDLLAALRTHTIVAAVGPRCADSLARSGIVARVVPEHPKMGAMVASLARFLSQRRVA